MKLKLDYYILNYLTYFKLVIVNSYSSTEYTTSKSIVKDIIEVFTYIFSKITTNSTNDVITL